MLWDGSKVYVIGIVCVIFCDYFLEIILENIYILRGGGYGKGWLDDR